MDYENKFRNKIFKMASFCKEHNVNEVPDPYYEGSEGFEHVLDILEDGCGNLLDQVKNEIYK